MLRPLKIIFQAVKLFISRRRHAEQRGHAKAFQIQSACSLAILNRPFQEFIKPFILSDMAGELPVRRISPFRGGRNNISLMMRIRACGGNKPMFKAIFSVETGKLGLHLTVRALYAVKKAF